MSKKSRNIKAFTLVDVMSGMVIISIVMSMTFFLMSSINKQTHDFQKLKLNVNQLMILQNDLKRQIELADQITEIPNGFITHIDQNQLTYKQDGDLLIRRKNFEVDTLQQQLISIETKTCHSKTDLINEVNLHVNVNGYEMNLLFTKDYSSANTINSTLLNGD